MAGYGNKRFKSGYKSRQLFSSRVRVRIANKKISKAFGGSTQLSILVEGDIFDPKILNNIELLTDHVKNKYSIVTKSYSIVDVIKNAFRIQWRRS